MANRSSVRLADSETIREGRAGSVTGPLLAWIVAGKVAATTGLGDDGALNPFRDEHSPGGAAATTAARTAKDQNRALTLHLLSVEERPRSTGGGWPSDTRTPSSRAFVVLSGRRPGSVRDEGPHSCGTAPESHRLRCRKGWRESSTGGRGRASAPAEGAG